MGWDWLSGADMQIIWDGPRVPEAPPRAEFLQKRLISAFKWQNLAEILRLLPKVLQSENKAVILSPLFNICPQQIIWALINIQGFPIIQVEST